MEKSSSFNIESDRWQFDECDPQYSEIPGTYGEHQDYMDDNGDVVSIDDLPNDAQIMTMDQTAARDKERIINGYKDKIKELEQKKKMIDAKSDKIWDEIDLIAGYYNRQSEVDELKEKAAPYDDKSAELANEIADLRDLIEITREGSV